MGQWSSRLLFNEIYAWGRYCLWYFVHRCLDQTWERQENRDGFVGSYLAPTWWLDVIYYEQIVQGAGLSWRNSEHNQCYIWAQTWVEERGRQWIYGYTFLGQPGLTPASVPIPIFSFLPNTPILLPSSLSGILLHGENKSSQKRFCAHSRLPPHLPNPSILHQG